MGLPVAVVSTLSALRTAPDRGFAIAAGTMVVLNVAALAAAAVMAFS